MTSPGANRAVIDEPFGGGTIDAHIGSSEATRGVAPRPEATASRQPLKDITG